jgi:hypothetical protein
MKEPISYYYASRDVFEQAGRGVVQVQPGPVLAPSVVYVPPPPPQQVQPGLVLFRTLKLRFVTSGSSTLSRCHTF